MTTRVRAGVPISVSIGTVRRAVIDAGVGDAVSTHPHGQVGPRSAGLPGGRITRDPRQICVVARPGAAWAHAGAASAYERPAAAGKRAPDARPGHPTPITGRRP